MKRTHHELSRHLTLKCIKARVGDTAYWRGTVWEYLGWGRWTP